MKKKKISIASAKAKGRGLQQWTASRISKLIQLPYGSDQPIASREMGQNGTDIRLVGEALKRFPWSVECKRCEKWNIPLWIEQTKSNLISDTDWLLICKKSHKEAVAIIDAEILFELLKLIPFPRKGRQKKMKRRRKIWRRLAEYDKENKK